ncbi:MAG: hypothetical protein A3G25_14105 [Betaproteobacteria bacterium RIFCSPLOWO2_12_FULL_63_13]|nr:MAG: hypothetical protein A3H35_01760 [Betaproteobacteria bacterium RIFCSPLOWO2_02_FULL_62_17]OGA46117.1 MAG: hypothetical protein A3G25_14105 [Betaproteobacteria bacterium RIFCSPLOWO2_12_FULL_63_13]
MKRYRGWLVVASVFFALAIVFGVAYSFSAFFSSFERCHSMHHEHAVTHRPARSVAFQAPRAQPVDNRL